jgi:ribonuclease T2
LVPLDTAVKPALAVLFAALLVSACPRLAVAQGVPGDFDFYVLALSWSPSFCAIDGGGQQCSGGRHGFVVHGLWPQYERGYPEYCASTMDDWVSSELVDSLRDIMPGGGLVGSQWRKHGLCSGLEQSNYFDLARQAYEKVTIPQAFLASGSARSVPPSSVETAFIDANPGLVSQGIAVTCKHNALSEVRICLTRNLQFRECPEVDQDGCRASRINVPPVE